MALVFGFYVAGTRLGKMCNVDRRREGVDVAVAVALGFVQAVAAGEDEIGTREQPRFAVEQSGVGEAERRQFVHAVVDDRSGVHMLCEREHHRRVEPEHRLGANARGHQHVEQLPQPRFDLLGIPPMRQART